MAVPLLDLPAQHGALAGELRAAFERVLASGQFVLGPEVEALERELCALTGAAHALGLSSGTDALLLALMALDIGPGDEVIVPSFTFFATAGCVARVGATPVFADVCPVCFNLDPADAACKVTPRTKALLPVHLFGQAAELDGLAALAAGRGLHLIEDNAQALGGAYRGRPLGTTGAFGCGSFYPTKNLGALGDAGFLTVNDEALYRRAKRLRVHGMEPVYHHHEVGGNFRLDAFQAAFLRAKLPLLPAWNTERGRLAGRYGALLGALPGVVANSAAACACLAGTGPADGSAGAPRLILPVAYPHNDHVWHQYTVLVPGAGRRDALLAHLKARGVGCGVFYPIPLHRQRCFAPFTAGRDPACPVAEALAASCLSLPMYPELGDARQDEVAAAIAEFLAAGQ